MLKAQEILMRLSDKAALSPPPVAVAAAPTVPNETAEPSAVFIDPREEATKLLMECGILLPAAKYWAVKRRTEYIKRTVRYPRKRATSNIGGYVIMLLKAEAVIPC